MITPEPVSPAPDTEALRDGQLWSVLDWSLWGNGLGDVLRSEMADVMIAALTPEQREQAEACIKSWHERRSPSMAVGVGTQLQRERDEARAEVDRLKSYLLGRRNNLAQLLGQPASEEDTGWYGLCAQVQEREAGLRADLDRMHSTFQTEHDFGLKLREEIARLRAELARVSGARPIPDDADDYVIGALARRMRNAGEPLSEVQTSVLVDVVTTLFRSWLSTPTTGPAPAAADEPRVWNENDPEPDPRPESVTTPDGRERIYAEDWGGWVLRNEPGGLSDQWEDLPKPLTEVLAAAPQAPAEPTAHVMLCPTCGTYTAGVSGEVCVNDGTVLRPTEPMASCGYHTEAAAQTSVRHELCTPAAREDTARPDGHTVDVVANEQDDFLDVLCMSGCGCLGVCISEQGANDLADRHRADTARPPGPVVPLCADCGEQPATDPQLTVNNQRVCGDCWTEVEANAAADPEEV